MPTDYIAYWLNGMKEVGWSSAVNLGSTAFKLVLVIVMAVVLGCERARNRHAAGLRTFIVLSIGSMFAGVADLFFINNLGVGFSFLSAAVIIGISIITANTIVYSSKNQIMGLTTSFGVWTMSIIAALVGLGLYSAALLGFAALMVGLLAFSKLEYYITARSNHFEIHLELKTRSSLQEFITAAREFGLKIDNLEVNPAYANSGLSVYTVRFTVVDKALRKKSHNDIIEALSVLDCVYHIESLG